MLLLTIINYTAYKLAYHSPMKYFIYPSDIIYRSTCACVYIMASVTLLPSLSRGTMQCSLIVYTSAADAAMQM